jgi:DNA-binding response OmpR family regulator
LRAHELTLDLDSHTVTLRGQRIDLTPSEFDLLAMLMGAPGRAFSRLDMLERLQGVALEGSERNIDVHIRNLRTKIEPDPRNPRYIESIYGVGYRFVADG